MNLDMFIHFIFLFPENKMANVGENGGFANFSVLPPLQYYL